MNMLISKDEETIIALCTPSGSGAIALLRLSGSKVKEIIKKISKFPQQKEISQFATHTVHFGYIIDENKKPIDQVLFIIMDGPNSFTGQDTIEITCHNNPFIIENIISQAIKNGARLAFEGEFTKRAFLNNKIDLIQAESINELIHANTQLALKKSLSQLQGTFSSWIFNIEEELVRTLAWCEASFEFLDEQQEFGKEIKANIQKIILSIKELQDTFDIQQQIKQGIRIALIGCVNAGKSSIFNTLLNQKRSIVTEIAGTTRDVIEAGLFKNGNYWTLIDTAGIRTTDNIIEQEGINRSFQEAHKADIIIVIYDGSRNLNKKEEEIYKNIINLYKQKIIIVHNKSDLPEIENYLFNYKEISFSSLLKNNIKDLETLIEKKISQLFTQIESPFMLNKRQFNLLISLEKKLLQILEMFHKNINYELISFHLKDALEDISELSGKSINEASIDMVFKEFCVGK